MSADERAVIERTYEAVLRGEWNYLLGRQQRFLYLYETKRWAQILDEGLTTEPIPMPVRRAPRPRLVKAASAA